MTSESHVRRLDALVRDRDRADWAAASGEGPGELSPEVRERLPDLVSDESLRHLAEAAEEAPDGDVRWWRLAAAAREALAHRSREVRAEVDARAARWWLSSRLEISSLEAAEVVLARTGDAGRRDRIGESLAPGCVLISEGLSDLAEARKQARPAPLREVRPWERARGRSIARVREVAGELLERTDDEFAEACLTVRRIEGGRDSDPGPWVDLPRFLAGEELSGGAPGPDRELLVFVLGRLDLERSLGGRLRLVHGRPPAHLPVPGAYILEPGRRVVAAWTDRGRMRDYRGLLSVLGQALPAALAEDGRGPEGRFRDPAVQHMFGALFEGLVACPQWVESALRGAVPAAWLRAMRLYEWLRLRQLAAQLAGSWDAAEADLPAMVSGDALARATGFRHPDGSSPWSDTRAAAADELFGRLAAVQVGDALAARHGRDWTTPAAGRALRDLWAAGRHGCLDALLADLGLDRASPEPILELRRPILR